MSQSNGSSRTVRLPRAVMVAYLVLQGASAAALFVTWLLLTLAVRAFLPGADDFNTSWVAAFLIVPVGFLPVLVWWHGWACQRYGKHPRWWRVCAEVAFAVDVIGCLILRGVA